MDLIFVLNQSNCLCSLNVKNSTHLSIYPFFKLIILHKVKRNIGSIPGEPGNKVEDTRDRVLSHRRAQPHTHTLRTI